MISPISTVQAAATVFNFFRPVKIEDGSAPDNREADLNEVLLTPKEKSFRDMENGMGTLKSLRTGKSLPLEEVDMKVKAHVASPMASPKPLLSQFAMTVFIVIAWYSSNIGILLTNKYLLSNYGFKYPIFITLCHMLACTVMSYAAEVAGIVRRQSMTSHVHFLKVAALSTAFLCSVALGNSSLRFIPVSFAQAIGATTPVFTAVLAFVMLKQQETAGVYLTLVPVVAGIVIATGFEPSFNLIGFSLAVFSTASRALKSVLQAKLLSDQSERLDAMNLLRWMAPISGALLLPATVYLEPNVISLAATLSARHPWFLAFLCFNCFLAYFVNLTNFLVTKYTSALSLQVLGNAKGVIAVFISILVFQNPITLIGSGGYLITVTGVFCYGLAKKRAAQKAQEEKDDPPPKSTSPPHH
eukprot:jgi/Botrbrau1/10227/Bobra.0362s0017.1